MRGEYRERDAARETHDNRVRDELDDRAEFQRTHQQEDDARYDRGDGQPLKPEILDDAVDNHDKSARGPAYLHVAATQQGDDETADDSRYQTFFRTYARRDTESDGERQGHDAHDNTRHQVSHESFLGIVFQRRQELGLKIEFVTHCLFAFFSQKARS